MKLLIGILATTMVSAVASAYQNHSCTTITDSVICHFKSDSGLSDAQWTVGKGIRSDHCAGDHDVNISEFIVRSGGASFSLAAPQHLPEYKTNFDSLFSTGILNSKQFISGHPDFGPDAHFQVALNVVGQVIDGAANIQFNLNTQTAQTDVYHSIRHPEAAAEQRIGFHGKGVCLQTMGK